MCRCYVIPLMKTNDEFFSDAPNLRSVNQVDDVPENFKQWVQANSNRIQRAKSLPYFIQDNPQFVMQAQKAPLTIAEQAAIRHAKRTPEQIAAIQKAWDEKLNRDRITRLTASNVLKVAKDYSEIDYTVLQKAFEAGNLNAMKAETKLLAKRIVEVRKDEKALSALIPNVHEWKKQFTSQELHQVYDAVEKKLAQLSSLPLEEQAKKLHFEAHDFLGGNMKGVQSKYATWQVSQSAYIKQLAKVQYQIDLKDISSKIAEIEAWSAKHPKSKNVAKFLENAKLEIAKGSDISTVKNKVAIAESEYNKRLAEQARRDKKKLAGQKSKQFDDDAYSQERKDKAFYTDNPSEADKKYRNNAYDIWKNSSEKAKKAIYDYTTSYHNIQEPLRGITYRGGNSLSMQEWRERVNAMTETLAKSKLNTDAWFQRGDDLISNEGIDVFKSRFGISLNGLTVKEAQKYIGIVGHEKGFLSMGSCKGSGFDAKSVIMNIYAPKGTQALYINPISYFGGDKDGFWQGEATLLHKELETLLQRGSILKITKIRKNGTKWYVDVDVIGFDYSHK